MDFKIAFRSNFAAGFYFFVVFFYFVVSGSYTDPGLIKLTGRICVALYTKKYPNNQFMPPLLISEVFCSL